MRILYLCCDPGIPVFGRKGASSHVRGTCHALLTQGHEVSLVCANSNGDPDGEISIPTHCVQGPESKRLGFDTRRILLDRKFYRETKRIIESEGVPDAIYERYCLYSRTGYRLAKEFRLPHILELNAFLSVEQKTRIRVPALARWVERRTISRATEIFVVSEPLRNSIIEIRDDNVPIEIEPMSVDTRRFSDQVDGTRVREALGFEEQFVIGYVGTLSGWHGIRLLYEAVDALQAKGIKDFRVLVVGGEGAKLEKHRGIARERGMEKIIHFHGDVAHKDIPAYIRAMDIGIIPDANPWNAPTKLFEYQSCGVPPVGPGYPGVRTSIDDGVDGLIFPPKDIGAMVERIALLHGDKEKRAAMGRAARIRAVNTRSWDAAASKIVTHFESQGKRISLGPDSE